jgi:biopolymer transport protein ExbD
VVKSAVKDDKNSGDRLEGTPSQIMIRTALDTEKDIVADVGVPIDQALKMLETRLKEMAKKGASKANLKIAADGDLRQEYVMRVYDTCKRAGFDKLHFVPPPVLNSKINQQTR